MKKQKSVAKKELKKDIKIEKNEKNIEDIFNQIVKSKKKNLNKYIQSMNLTFDYNNN